MFGVASADVLLVGVGRLDNDFEVCLRKIEVGLGVLWLLFPRQHLLLVKAVAVIDLLQIELEFVIVGYGDIRLDEGLLIIIELLPERR